MEKVAGEKKGGGRMHKMAMLVGGGHTSSAIRDM